MDPNINNSTLLSSTEVSTIRNSRLVQTDGQNFWININPVAIVAAATTQVPEPSTLLLLLLSISFLVSKNRLKN